MIPKRGRSAALALTLLISAVLAGCISDDPDLPDDELDEGFSGILARGEPLWHAPQDFPHPAFGWSTLTNPPAGEDVPEWWKPIAPAEIPDVISGFEHVAAGSGVVPHGGGFAAFGSLISMPTFWEETYILDISDPTNPEVLSVIERQTRGAVMIPYPDGTLLTVYSTNTQLLIYDITDPEDPKDLGALDPVQGSHKVGVVPGTPIVYNAASAGGGDPPANLDPETAEGVTEIYDFTDPLDPQLVMDFENGYSCHHVYFHIDADKDMYRAICAGKAMTQIWDISDPLDPEVISNVPMPLGEPFPSLGGTTATFSHFSILSRDGDTLIVGDEPGGGSAPACDFYAHAEGTTISGPMGNLWFYDVSDLDNPTLEGWVSPSHHFPTNPPSQDQGGPTEGIAGCTAHHGRLVPDPEGERDLIAMPFYGAGVTLIDFTDPANPEILQQWNDNTNTWETWYYNGYLFTGDLSRGMDVFTLR